MARSKPDAPGTALMRVGGAPPNKPIWQYDRRRNKEARQYLATHQLEVAQALVDACLSGDALALREYFRRVWGEVPRVLDVTQQTTQLQHVEIVLRRVDPPKLVSAPPLPLELSAGSSTVDSSIPAEVEPLPSTANATNHP